MKRLLLGNEAIGRGVYESGVQVVASYPGTPSTEITEYIAQYDEIYSEWSVNEKVAAEVAFGASIAGVRSFCAQKHVGLNVCADLFFTASYTGINGGMVIAVADDPGIHSSQNEQDSRHYALAAKLPMLEPSDSEECLQYVKQAYEISETFDTPVFIRLTTAIAHSRSVVDIGERKEWVVKPYEKNIEKYVMLPRQAQIRHAFVEARTEKIKQYANHSNINTIEWNDKKIGIISSGVVYQYAKEAFGEMASYLKLGMVWPLPEQLLQEFASSVETLYVLEELDDFIEMHCKKLGISCIGKDFFSFTGEYSVAMIREKILGIKKQTTQCSIAIPARPPVMCAGCPHRATFHILNKLHITVSGDIGCYSLGASEPLSAMDMNVCMGASIGMLHGMEKALGKNFAKKSVAIIGDSTFLHSGMTALLDVVYNKGTSTILVLDNSTTAMTGHQNHPSTGKTIHNEPTETADIATICKALGVKRVFQMDPIKQDEFKKRLITELDVAEPSVIILKRPCVLLQETAKNKPLHIDEKKCHGCRKCVKTGCPAISFKKRNINMKKIKQHPFCFLKNLRQYVLGNAEIDTAMCSGCGLCKTVCRFHAIQT